MRHKRIWQLVRVAALAATASLAFGSMAWAQDGRYYDNDDSYNRRDDAREHGYRNGYNDGLRTGQSDADRGRRFKFKNDDWEDSRGFEHWMGNKGQYKKAYRDGYERGYRRGFGSTGYRDGYRWRDRDDWR